MKASIKEIKNTAKLAAERIDYLEGELKKIASESEVVQKQLDASKKKLAYEQALLNYVTKVASEGIVDPGELEKLAKDMRDYTEGDVDKIEKVDKILRRKIANGQDDIGTITDKDFNDKINKE